MLNYSPSWPLQESQPMTTRCRKCWSNSWRWHYRSGGLWAHWGFWQSLIHRQRMRWKIWFCILTRSFQCFGFLRVKCIVIFVVHGLLHAVACLYCSTQVAKIAIYIGKHACASKTTNFWALSFDSLNSCCHLGSPLYKPSIKWIWTLHSKRLNPLLGASSSFFIKFAVDLIAKFLRADMALTHNRLGWTRCYTGIVL